MRIVRLFVGIALWGGAVGTVAEAADLPITATYGTTSACNALRQGKPLDASADAGDGLMLLTAKSIGGFQWTCGFNTFSRAPDGKYSVRAACDNQGSKTENVIHLTENLATRVMTVQIDNTPEAKLGAC